MRATLFVILVLGLAGVHSGASFADDEPMSSDQLARELMRITDAASSADKMMESMAVQIRAAFPTVPEQLWDEFFGSIDTEEMMELSIPIYTKHYSREDLAGLIEFYQTPLGKRVISATPAIMQESFAVGAAWGQQKAAEVVEKLRARGYEPVNI
jgi:hypothetical protein